MQDQQAPADNSTRRTPWNKGKIVGAWSIRTKLQMEDRKRERRLTSSPDEVRRLADVVGDRALAADHRSVHVRFCIRATYGSRRGAEKADLADIDY